MFNKKTKIIILAFITFFLLAILFFLFIFKNNISKNNKTVDKINLENSSTTTTETAENTIIVENYEELKKIHPEFSSAQLEFYKDMALKGEIESCAGRDDTSNCVLSVAFLTQKYFLCGDEVLEDVEAKIKCTDSVLSKIAATEIKKCSPKDIIDYKIECLVNIFRIYPTPEDCSSFTDNEIKKMCTSVANYQAAQTQRQSERCDKIEDIQLKIYCIRALTGKSPDTDNDGLSDYDEISKYYTNPNKPDTDGDGYNDGDEVKKGFDPNTVVKLTPEK